MADYIVVGGGLAGCVVATRLKEYQPSSSVTMIELGPDEHVNPLITEPFGIFQLHGTELEYNYKTAPQKHFDGRPLFTAGGKILSGSSGVNYAMWTRGDATDYDVWGDTVNDKRWSYAGQLPYFKKTEHHFDSSASPEVHGFKGPVHTTPINRSYPMKELVRRAYEQIGIPASNDLNDGNPHGYSPLVESWKDGKRQPVAQSYGLKGVDVMISSPVKKILLEREAGSLVAKGVELVDGQQLMAKKEVIICCGAVRTPQLLMLSGIGPAHELAKFGIPLVLEAPDVGQHLMDHASTCLYYKVRNPEDGLCVGSPVFHARDSDFVKGLPVDWVILQSVPTEDLKRALVIDGEDEKTHPLVTRPRNPIEIVVAYAAMQAPYLDLDLPVDGSVFVAAAVTMLPTSRGTVTLSSTNPLDNPVIDPNYFATEVDKVITRAGMRTAMAAMETPEMAALVNGQVDPIGHGPITSKSKDEELDARVRRTAWSWYHLAGSCAMGKVVDANLKVNGVKSLRIVDASVYPTPIAAHLQAPTYALAEQAAEIIARG